MTEIVKYDNKINCEHLLGKFLDDSHYDRLIDNDCDLYDITGDLTKQISEDNIIFKFRKNVFSKEEQLGAYDGLYESTNVETNNRGKATGPRGEKNGGRTWVTSYQKNVLENFLNPGINFSFDDVIENTPIEDEENKDRGTVWVRSNIEKLDGISYDTLWEDMIENLRKASNDYIELSELTKTYLNCISSTSYANVVHSNVVGFFGRYPRFPYGRTCVYNENHKDKYEKCFPFMRKLNSKFQEYLPKRYSNQWNCAGNLDEKFRVAGDTVFTTITTNRNFRTAAHRDAGDLSEGFSNLSVISKEKEWEGGYLVLPEFRVAINIRPGDLLLINNHEGIHGNTELIPPKGKSLEDMERISIVCYFRENMQDLGSYEYEMTRKDFVESRRTNKTHPEWQKLWNGVSPGMFDSEEWKQFLLDNDKEHLLKEYHSNLIIEKGLEDFF